MVEKMCVDVFNIIKSRLSLNDNLCTIVLCSESGNLQLYLDYEYKKRGNIGIDSYRQCHASFGECVSSTGSTYIAALIISNGIDSAVIISIDNNFEYSIFFRRISKRDGKMILCGNLSNPSSIDTIIRCVSCNVDHRSFLSDIILHG